MRSNLALISSISFLSKLRGNAKSLGLTKKEIDDIKARLERIYAKIQSRRPDK